jgi:RNA polymerase sigma-70 factor (ECF subfamily)
MKPAAPEWGSSIRDAAVSDDAALVRRCQQRDPAAVRQLIERFQSEVFGLCVRILAHRQDAEDVCQEVFLRIFRSLHRWDRSRPLRPWVMGITVNRCRTWLTQRARRPELVDYLQDTATGRPEDDVDELVREIAAAVAELRPDYRLVFVMFHEQSQPYEEIAEALDRPVGTIKTWLHRARLEVLQRLRERGMVTDEMAEPESPRT